VSETDQTWFGLMLAGPSNRVRMAVFLGKRKAVSMPHSLTISWESLRRDTDDECSLSSQRGPNRVVQQTCDDFRSVSPDRIEFMSAVVVLPLRAEELDAAHFVYRFARRFAGICSLPQSPPWAATCTRWRSLLIGLTEVCVVFGSHPCWQ
jgi:hypothetical protein